VDFEGWGGGRIGAEGAEGVGGDRFIGCLVS